MSYSDKIVYTDCGDVYYGESIPHDVSRRPGREPSLPDHELSAEELKRRNNRRRRNREAAKRVRERRMSKMQQLEKQVQELKNDSENLHSENARLRKELAKLRGQVGPRTAQRLNAGPRLTRQISNTEMPVDLRPPQIKLENDIIHNNQSNQILFTPGGTFVLTPIKQESMRFDFPVPVDDSKHADTADYSKIITSL
jgi:predicted RNase H-like nuclease (RuvC/YqgF family)